MTSLHNDPTRTVDAGATFRLIARCDLATPGHLAEILTAVSTAQRHAASGHDAGMRRWGARAVGLSLLLDRGLLDTGLPQDLVDAQTDAEDLMGLHPYGRIPAREPVLELGVVLIHPDLLSTLSPPDYAGVQTFVARHQRGDWGCLDNPIDTEAHAAVNNLAVTSGYQVISTYELPNYDEVWVVTKADRTSTTVLRPNSRN